MKRALNHEPKVMRASLAIWWQVSGKKSNSQPLFMGWLSCLAYKLFPSGVLHVARGWGSVNLARFSYKLMPLGSHRLAKIGILRNILCNNKRFRSDKLRRHTWCRSNLYWVSWATWQSSGLEEVFVLHTSTSIRSTVILKEISDSIFGTNAEISSLMW